MHPPFEQELGRIDQQFLVRRHNFAIPSVLMDYQHEIW
jgi:hypothetical protein